MGVLLGLVSLNLTINWICYLFLTVLMLSEPNRDQTIHWAIATPFMALLAFVSLRVIDRFSKFG